ncbi:MAG TPA: murein biosynthesis integral membrane protein MurJ [Candidatus Cloacimonadota bacterium]|nr:murein biosynthesis integral membrane protein MurJ [Candidatus Cloacimonadota bacterium]
MSNRKLAKNIATMSIAVFLSRILGLVRDQVMAYFFGTTWLNDAFNVAYTIPNLLRRLFGEGALSTAFVPIYNDIGAKEGKKQQFDFALNIISILTFILSLMTLIGMIFAPIIVKLIYPGLAPETLITAIKLTRITFPYLFFISLSSTLIAILNSHDYFFMTGLSSALLNLGMILTVLIPFWVTGAVGEELVIWAGWGVCLGGLFQTLSCLPYMRTIGYRIKIILKFSGTAITMLWKRFIPSMIGIGIREINLIADGIMASFLPIGSITALGFGNRLMQLPLGIFAISAGTAVLPHYSRFASQDKPEELSESMRFSSVTLAYIMLPITVIILALGQDFVYVLFQQGEFDTHASIMTYKALLFYSIGLIFYSMNQIITPVFYAYKDTKTPVLIAIPMVILNIVLNYILMQFMAHSGLALSTSITAIVNLFLILYILRKKIPGISFKGIFENISKALIISTLIYILLVVTNSYLPHYSKLLTLVKDGILSILAFVLFYLIGLVWRIDYIKEFRQNLWNRFLKK